MISIRQTSIKEKKNRHNFKDTETTRRYYKFLKMQSHKLVMFL